MFNCTYRCLLGLFQCSNRAKYSMPNLIDTQCSNHNYKTYTFAMLIHVCIIEIP